MADETDFFGAPPAGDAPLPPAAEDAGFTLLGEAEAPAPSMDGAPTFVGDVHQDIPADGFGGEMMGFAAAPPDDDAAGEMMGFAAAPPLADDSANPPPIILGAPPPVVEDDDDDVFGGAVMTDTAPIETEPMEPSKPSAMSKFNAEFQDTLKQRQEDEDTAKADMVAAAKDFVDNFKAKREAKRDAKMAKNREDEQAKLECIEADLEEDNSWQRVSKMVELTQDSSLDDTTEDTKQMRDLFIKLKNEEGLAAKVGA